MQVIKIGGNELAAPGFLSALAEAIAALAEPAVVVHGGGKAIADLQTRLGLEPVKVDGLRVTDAASLAAAQMVLSGGTNKQIVAALLAAGVDAFGFSGVDGGLLRCRQKQHPTADLGYVGEVVAVRVDLLRQLAAVGITAVISPISIGRDGQIYNVNADEAAGAIAAALSAAQLTLVSNVPGVLRDGRVIPSLTPAETEQLIQEGVVRGGMAPKVRAAVTAVTGGVPQARIVDLAGMQGGGTRFVS
jgi:acetylglutamate kinase